MLMWIAFYLIGCAGTGKWLANKPAKTRKIVAGTESAVMLLIVAAMADFNPLVISVAGIIAYLGFVTIVARPKWIVGEKY